jgi:Family of unknown function (DUF6455)
MFTSTNLSLLARAFDWLKVRMAQDNELASLSRADLQLLAIDIGVTEADLRQIIPQVHNHGELMDKMMCACGLEPASVRRAFSGVVRDMEVTCARCRDSGRCYRELEAGTSSARYRVFCANASAIDALLEARTNQFGQ